MVPRGGLGAAQSVPSSQTAQKLIFSRNLWNKSFASCRRNFVSVVVFENSALRSPRPRPIVAGETVRVQTCPLGFLTIRALNFPSVRKGQQPKSRGLTEA